MKKYLTENLKVLLQLFTRRRFITYGKEGFGHTYGYGCAMLGKTVIHFISHGCMATIHEFDYIGIIVERAYPEHCNGKMYYRVKVLKDKSGYELRDSKEERFREVPSWYLQNLGGDFYIVYD